MRTLTCIAFLAFASCGPVAKPTKAEPQAPPKSAPAPAPRATKEDQDAAALAIRKIIDAGGLKSASVEDGLAIAVVTDAFMATSFKNKEAIAVVVSTWAYETPRGVEPRGTVVFRDFRFGKTVGKYVGGRLVME